MKAKIEDLKQLEYEYKQNESDSLERSIRYVRKKQYAIDLLELLLNDFNYKYEHKSDYHYFKVSTTLSNRIIFRKSNSHKVFKLPIREYFLELNFGSDIMNGGTMDEHIYFTISDRLCDMDIDFEDFVIKYKK